MVLIQTTTFNRAAPRMHTHVDMMSKPGFLSQPWLHFEVAVPPFACDLLAFLDVRIQALCDPVCQYDKVVDTASLHEQLHRMTVCSTMNSRSGGCRVWWLAKRMVSLVMFTVGGPGLSRLARPQFRCRGRRGQLLEVVLIRECRPAFLGVSEVLSSSWAPSSGSSHGSASAR